MEGPGKGAQKVTQETTSLLSLFGAMKVFFKDIEVGTNAWSLQKRPWLLEKSILIIWKSKSDYLNSLHNLLGLRFVKL